MFSSFECWMSFQLTKTFWHLFLHSQSNFLDFLLILEWWITWTFPRPLVEREEWRSRAEGIIDIAIHEEVWESAVYLKTLIEHPSSSRVTDAVACGHIHQRPELFIHCHSTLFPEGPGAEPLLHLIPCSLWAELIIRCFSVLWGGEKQPFWMGDNESLIKNKCGVCVRGCVLLG